MRDFKGMKRQRNRGRGGGGGGGGKPQHNANRAFDSNGPDGVKVRGAAQHIYEKYQQLARDAASGGDRVLAENYLQHAEHYFRVLRAMQPQRPLAEIIGRDQFASGYDIDFEEEPQAEAAETAEGEADGDGRQGDRQGQGERPWDRQRDERGPREDRQGGDYRQQQGDFRPRDGYRQQNDFRARDERPRDDRPRDDRPRDDFRQRDDRDQGEYRQRDDRYRDDRPRDERPRDDRDRPRDDRPRDDRQGRFRDDRPRDDRQNRFRDRPEREPRPERDPLTVVEPQAAAPLSPAPAYEAPEAPQGGMLRGEDGTMSAAPAFLQTRAAPEPTDEAAGEARRPRRRRAPRNFEADEAAPADVDEG